MTRKLGMELAGFDPLNTFSEEQIELMRSIEPQGYTANHRRTGFGNMFDRADFRGFRLDIFKERNQHEGF